MEIIRGKIPGARKICVYGPEGIGKSTIASQFPEPLFIDTEGSTKDMDVARTPTPSSWEMLLSQIRYVRDNTGICKTLVLDTADWAEILCSAAICSRTQKQSIEDFGYGKGYVYLQEEFGKLLNLLEEVVVKGIHVVLTAHAKMRKFEQPDELGAYDRWEMKLTKQVSPMVKEWADMVLFVNYKTLVVNVDGQGSAKGKNKAQGGKRVMYTSHHSCWDAKNRYGLPDEVPFEYASIAHIMVFEGKRSESAVKEEVKRPSAPPVSEQKQNPLESEAEIPSEKSTTEPAKEEKANEESIAGTSVPVEEKVAENTKGTSKVNERIPKTLRDLMIANKVDEWDIQNVVSAKGYFPPDMDVADYPPDFIEGCLVGAWSKVYAIIVDMKQNQYTPFN